MCPPAVRVRAVPAFGFAAIAALSVAIVASVASAQRARAPANRAGSNARPAADDNAGRGLHGEYFEGKKYETRLMERIDPEVDFQWGNGTPGEQVQLDAFSARWTGWIRAPRAGRYKFLTEADNEARLEIDGQLVLEGAGDREGFADLTGRPQALKVEYVDSGGWGTMSLHWLPPGERFKSIVPAEVLFHDPAVAARPKKYAGPPKGTGLRLSFFQGDNFGKFLFSRPDYQVDSLWHDGLLDPRLPPDDLTLRWEAYLKAPRPGRYRLTALGDDGVRVYLDGKKVIEKWGGNGGFQSGDAPVELTDKPHPLVVEYQEKHRNAYVSLHWEQIDGFKEQIIPPEAFFTDKALAERAGDAAGAKD